MCRGEELLATVDVNLWLPNGLPMLPRLRSLAAWLVTTQGGAHVRSLSIAVGLSGLECDEHSRAEAQALLGTCCSACPGLRVLRLDANVSLLLTSWLAALRSLQRLHVTSTRDLELVWSLRGCARGWGRWLPYLPLGRWGRRAGGALGQPAALTLPRSPPPTLPAQPDRAARAAPGRQQD